MAEDGHRDPFIFGPDLRVQYVDALAANTASPVAALHEELAEIEMIRLLPKQRVGQDLSIFLKNRDSVAGFEQLLEALDQLRNRHAIAMALVLDQLMVKQTEGLGIFRGSQTVVHHEQKI